VPNLLVERDGYVTVLTLNSPEKHNAFDLDTREALGSAMLEFDADPEQYVAVITGAGDRAFCSGSDLSAPGGGRTDTGHRRFALTDMFGIGAVTKPVIAAVNGLAVGGGCEIALACDFRICARSAWFSLPEPAHGIIPGAAVHLLPRLVCRGDAAWILLTAARVDAAEALRIGLVQRVVDDGQALAESLVVARAMCGLSQVALQAIKRTLLHERNLLLTESLDVGKALIELAATAGDLDEGLRALSEKRPPRFSNRWPRSQ
jgi:enoyl-CoA hydratase/carnithine racemase